MSTRTSWALALALLGGALATDTAPAPWSTQGRQVERSSTSRTDISVHFTLLPGEDPLRATVECLKATRAAYSATTWVDCMAFTPEGYAALSGKIRPCYSVIARWFRDEGGLIRLYFAQDDREYPRRCPEGSRADGSP